MNLLEDAESDCVILMTEENVHFSSNKNCFEISLYMNCFEVIVMNISFMFGKNFLVM
jgi:hypothetical protein